LLHEGLQPICREVARQSDDDQDNRHRREHDGHGVHERFALQHSAAQENNGAADSADQSECEH
jgi:hypothetical protein